jgi:hypothetical protein
LFLTLNEPAAKAQFDSSSTVLLRSGGKAPSQPALDSSRYKVRTPESRKESADDIDEKPGTYIPSPVPRTREGKAAPPTPAETPASAPATVVPTLTPTPSPTGEAPAAPVSTAAERAEPPPVTVQVRELILGGSEDIEEYKSRVHPQDPRANILSFSFAPAYFYNGSSSNYSYRSFHSDGPGLGLGMNLWLTPFFGVQSKYFSSFSSGVRDAGGIVPTDTQEFEAGLRFRRHFGYSRKSAQLSWGIDYRDSSNKISRDAVTLVGRKTSGLSLSIEGVLPTSVTYAHTFEVAIRPWQHHSEPGTSIDVHSGAKNQTNGVHLGLGGQWTLDRHNQVFWKGQYSVERNLFDGPASQADAHGNTPDGVSVTNSLLIFYFGFKWGA